MIVIGHWIDHEWNINSVTMDFRRFSTPHTGLATAALLGHAITNWDLEWRLLSITDDIASDIFNGMKLLFDDLKGQHGTLFTTMNVFQVRCFCHVLNLTGRECLKLIDGPVT